MSRVGKQIIEIPEKTEVLVEDGTIRVRGPLGELDCAFRSSDVDVTVADRTVTVSPKRNSKPVRSLWGTYASHIKNMVRGVNEPFVKKLVVEGIGYRVEVSGDNLVLSVGYSHPVRIPIPKELTVSVEKNEITISGSDKELVGAFAASTRARKKPEPYKGKGIRYKDETVRRKQGKRAVT
jgi:large subunit ribosomal protein L6